MKIDAYKCDYCKKLYEAEYVQGIYNKPDMFLQDQFLTKEPEKCDCHFCLECYRVAVELNVKNKMNWRDGEKYDEARYKLKQELTNEYSGIFKKECYRRFNASKGLKK